MRNLPLAGLLLCLTAVVGRPAEFPKPEPEKAFPELKVYDSLGHPWRMAREDWDGARERLARDPKWASWLEGERAAVGRWMERQTDHVAWVCGWWHDFVSPKDGSYLQWTPAVPGVDVEFLHSASDPHVPITPKIFGGWVFVFRGHHAEMMQRAARLYRLTREERYAAWAAAQLDFYADHLQDWPVSEKGARLYWQTLDEATNCALYADTVRLLGGYATAPRREHWQRDFFNPTVALLNRTMLQIHNIATWQRCAAAQVALVFNDAALWHEAIDGKFGLRAQIAQGITSEYIWYEQSLHYNAYVVRALLTVFTAAGLQGRAAELAPEMAVAENLMLSTTYLRFPDGYTPNPADSTSQPIAPDPTVFSDTYRVFPTTLGLTAAAGRRDWDTLIDPPPPAPRPVVLPEVKSWNMASSRMALLKTPGWQVFFHYGQIVRSHAQAEALNFSAYYRGTEITHDPGTVGYGSPLYSGYYTRGLGHNAVLIDGEGETPPEPGELIEFSPTRVEARQPHYRKNAIAQRRLAIDGERLMDTLTVETTDGPHRLGLALHLQGKVELPASATPAPDFAQGRPAPFGFWQDVRVATGHDTAEFNVTYADGFVLQVHIDAPGAFHVWHGSTPDVPPHRRDSIYLELDDPAAKAQFVTRFTPARRDGANRR